jgi:hypothetical protein
MGVTASERECAANRPTEDERVLSWRMGRLERAGFSGEGLLALALRFDIDLRTAEAIVRRGCPAHTASRILL